MGLRVLHFIRHGQYFSEDGDAQYGHLTELGRRQARRLGEVYADFGIRRLRVSTLDRAQQTADEVQPLLGLGKRASHHFLREVIPAATAEHVSTIPALRGLAPSEQVALLNLAPGVRRALDSDFGELFGAPVERDRAKRAGRTLFRPWLRSGEFHELVISHGNLIRFLVCGVLAAPPEVWMHMNIHHCSITRFVVDANGEVMLDSFNETMHLPQELTTMV